MTAASPPAPLTLMGAPGSPYTRKMRAVLRYRHIPYRLIFQFSREAQQLPQPKVQLLPTFYLPDQNGKTVAVTDSTPLIRRFESEFSGRSVIPADPILGFIDLLLEDYADEWLTKCMSHYRWHYDADARKAATVIPHWARIDVSNTDIGPIQKGVRERQVERLWVVGSNEITTPVIEASYRRFLRLFDAHLQKSRFLLGRRPAASDFGVAGQLTCLAQFDPTPAAVTLEESARVHAWVDLLEDLSGLEPTDDDWIKRDAIPDTLVSLLAEVGRVYAPFLLANAAALERGAKQLETEIDNQQWVQKPFPYQAKCLAWLRDAHTELTPADRAAVDSILDGTGCEALFS